MRNQIANASAAVRRTGNRCAALAALLLLACACAPAAAPATPVPIRAVYLVTGQGVLAAGDLQAHPEILVVHSFDELAAHTQSKVAIWIDKSATPFDHADWLRAAPQAWYPLVLVGYNNTLYSFREMLNLCCFLGPIVDWRTVRVEPGFSVSQQEDSGGPLPVYTFGRGYDQVPTAADILAITDALLDGRLQTPPPTPETNLVGAPTENPPFPAPSSAPGVVSTVTPFVPPALTAQVELDAFSGRPNPSWLLSAADTETFRQKVATLSPASAQIYPQRLGYRGLIVRLPEASGFAVIWSVWDGAAQMTNGATTAYYADPHQDLESWLLQSGQPFLPADLFATVQAELSRHSQP